MCHGWTVQHSPHATRLVETALNATFPGVPPVFWEALALASAQLRVALVGGAVRDWYLHCQHLHPWQGVVDLDFVVQSEVCGAGTPGFQSSCSPASVLLSGLARQPLLNRISAREHRAYGTVELTLHVENQVLSLDLASARSEHYPVAAGHPEVSQGTIEDDLARRDFTINAMALLVDQGNCRTVLLDPHGGVSDLSYGLLRFLHANSFRDDPTRLIRAARYGARLGFALEKLSLQQVQQTLASWPWDWKQGDDPTNAPVGLATRLRMELDLLLQREAWPTALRLLQDWGGLKLLDPGLQSDHTWLSRLRRARRLGVAPLLALISAAHDPIRLARRLQMPLSHQRLLERVRLLEPRLKGSFSWTPSLWTAMLESRGCCPDTVALALVVGVGPRRPLLRWLLRWRHIRSPLTAQQLIEDEGLKPGEALGARLRQLRRLELDRQRF